MDLPRIELGALRLLSACDTTTPQAHLESEGLQKKYRFNKIDDIHHLKYKYYHKQKFKISFFFFKFFNITCFCYFKNIRKTI